MEVCERERYRHGYDQPRDGDWPSLTADAKHKCCCNLEVNKWYFFLLITSTFNPDSYCHRLIRIHIVSLIIISLYNAGAETFPNFSFGWVNVKDVANAHILAYEVPSASGRYCLVERVSHYSEVVRILHELYPALRLPEK